MPRPYEDPTLATLEAAQQLGVKDYATGADPGWSPAAKKRWVERLEALATGREKEDARLRNQAKYMAEAPVLNDVRLGIEAGGRDLLSMASRLVGDSKGADALNRQNDLEAEASSLAHRQSQAPDLLEDSVQGATRSLTMAAPLAATGPYGMIGGFAFSRGNQAMTEADDAGLKGWEKAKYVGTSAAIEGGVAAVFQRIGLGGTEKLLTGGRAGLREILAQNFGELAEENVTEILDQVNQQASGVSEPLDMEGYVDLVKRTTAQTLLAVNASGVYSNLKTKEQVREYANGLSAAYGIDPKAARAAVERAVDKKRDIRGAVGELLLNERALSPENLAQWAAENEESARAYVAEADAAASSGEQPSRGQWKAAGLDKLRNSRDAGERARVAGELRELLSAADVAEQQNRPAVEGLGAEGDPRGASTGAPPPDSPAAGVEPAVTASPTVPVLGAEEAPAASEGLAEAQRAQASGQEGVAPAGEDSAAAAARYEREVAAIEDGSADWRTADLDTLRGLVGGFKLPKAEAGAAQERLRVLENPVAEGADWRTASEEDLRALIGARAVPQDERKQATQRLVELARARVAPEAETRPAGEEDASAAAAEPVAEDLADASGGAGETRSPSSRDASPAAPEDASSRHRGRKGEATREALLRQVEGLSEADLVSLVKDGSRIRELRGLGVRVSKGYKHTTNARKLAEWRDAASKERGGASPLAAAAGTSLDYAGEAEDTGALSEELSVLASKSEALERRSRELKEQAETYAQRAGILLTRGRNRGKLKKSAPKKEVERYKSMLREAEDLNTTAWKDKDQFEKPLRARIERSDLLGVLRDESKPRVSRLAARRALHDLDSEKPPVDLEKQLATEAEALAKETYPDASEAEVGQLAPEVRARAEEEARAGRGVYPESLKEHSRLNKRLDLSMIRRQGARFYGRERGVYTHQFSPAYEVDRQVFKEIEALLNEEISAKDAAKARKLIDAEAKRMAEAKAERESDAKKAAAQAAKKAESQQARFTELLQGELKGSLTELRAKLDEIRDGDDTAQPKGQLEPRPIAKKVSRVKDTLRAIESHRHKEITRYAMEGVRVDTWKGQKVAVATDGKRLVVVPYDGELAEGAVWKRKKDSYENVAGRHFPPFAEVIPDPDGHGFTIAVTPELIDQLRGAARVAKVVGFDVPAEIELPGKKPVTANATYLLEAAEALTKAGHEVKEFRLKSWKEAVLVTTESPSALALVMPLSTYGEGMGEALHVQLEAKDELEAPKKKPKKKPRKAAKGFKDETGALPSSGAMSVVYQPRGASGDELFPQAASMNVGELTRLLKVAGADVAKIYPRLAGGAQGRFNVSRGIALDANVFLGPVIRTGTVRAQDLEVAQKEVMEEILEAFPELTEKDVAVKVEPGKTSALRKLTFYRRDPEFAAKVLAHEIGHWTDSMPDGVMARGNILGRLATLRRYLKSTLEAGSAVDGADSRRLASLRRQARKIVGDPPEGAKKATKAYLAWQEAVRKKRDELARNDRLLLRKDVEKELKALTRWWNPFDPEANEAYTRYRFGSDELYAEALSVLLNKPAELRKRAPLFYAAWHALLERKPAVKEAYELVVREVASGVSGEKLLLGVYEGQARGEEAVRRNAEASLKRRSFGTVVGTAFVDRFWRLHRLVNAARKQGRKFADPRHVIDKAKYTGAMIEEYERRNNEIALALEKANVSEQDFGAYLLLQRGLLGEGEGGDKAIPVVGDLAGAKKSMAALKEAMGPGRMAALEKARADFRAAREELVLARVEETGPYGKDFTEFLKRNEHYSRFEVVDYMERKLGKGASSGLGMPKRIGTVREVSNPWSATMASDMSLLWSVNWNHAKQATVDFLRSAGESGAVVEAETRWNGKAHVPVEPSDPNMGLVSFMRGGKLEGHYVEREVARAFETPSDAVRAVASYLRAPAHVARLWFTALRPGFQLFNAFFRDPIRTIVNLPAGKQPQAIYKNLFKSLGASWREEFSGSPDEHLSEMRKRGLLISWGNMAEVDEDTTRLERFLAKHRDNRTWREAITTPLAGWYSRLLTLGSIGETANKRAAFVFLRENQERLGWTDEQVDHAVRHWAGSPSFVTGGELTPILNNVLLFSNAETQGWRSDIEAFKSDPRGVATRRLAYAIMPKLVVAAFATGAMGALFRALGGDDDDEAVKFADVQERILSRVSEYDLANYTVIPLGLTEDNKAVYLRLPQDETDRVIGGAMVKLLTGDSALESLQGAASYAGDQGPGWNPGATLAMEVLQYIGGGNPYDSFRERHAVPDRIREAGGAESHKAFSKWVWNRYGGAMFYKFGSNNPADVQSEAEQLLNLPFVSDTAGRFVKVSDYGLVQKIERARERARAERTRAGLEVDAAVRRQLAGTPEEGDEELLRSDPGRAERIEEGLRARAGGPLSSALARGGSAEETAAVLRRFAELDPETPGLAEATAEFVGRQLYHATGDDEAEAERAKKLLEGLPPHDPVAAFRAYWVKRYKRVTKGYAPRARRARALLADMAGK